MAKIDPDLLRAAIQVATTVAPLVVPGAAPSVVLAGNAALKLLQKVDEVAGPEAEADLREPLADLEKRVLAHAERTIDSLGDEAPG